MASETPPAAVAPLPPPAPFCKWAGGKRKLLPAILPHIPPVFRAYFEPFVGGGALFFELQGSGRLGGEIVLGDVNAELVTTYTIIRDAPDVLLDELAALDQAFHRRLGEADDVDWRWAHFKMVRALDPTTLPPVGRAARFIYLNKTGHNGLYRENKKGEFNVPLGKKTGRAAILRPDAIRAASQALRGVGIRHGSFAHTTWDVGPGDVVYFDPPYTAMADDAPGVFVGYTADQFGPPQQRHLCHVAQECRGRGATVLVSGEDLEGFADAYFDVGFDVHQFTTRRLVGGKGSRRKPVIEILAVGVPTGRYSGAPMPQLPAPTPGALPAPEPRRAAVVSQDGVYRYTLVRELPEVDDDRTVVFILLNPSTADGTIDDPTARRGMGYARAWGYGRLVFVNLFAYRATKPQVLGAARNGDVDIVGPENDQHIEAVLVDADCVVAAWGAAPPWAKDRIDDVVALVKGRGKRLQALGTTANGSPRHPLYMRADAELRPWPDDDADDTPPPVVADGPVDHDRLAGQAPDRPRRRTVRPLPEQYVGPFRTPGYYVGPTIALLQQLPPGSVDGVIGARWPGDIPPSLLREVQRTLTPEGWLKWGDPTVGVDWMADRGVVVILYAGTGETIMHLHPRVRWLCFEETDEHLVAARARLDIPTLGTGWAQ